MRKPDTSGNRLGMITRCNSRACSTSNSHCTLRRCASKNRREPISVTSSRESMVEAWPSDTANPQME